MSMTTIAFATIYALLFSGVKLLEKKNHNVLIVDRGLQAVPFAALHSGNRFLGDRFAFAITPFGITISAAIRPDNRMIALARQN